MRRYQMLVYVLTNKWYQRDNLYKIGLHSSDDIDNLVSQYLGRYMPSVKVIKYWNVPDCHTTETIMHKTLRNTKGVSQFYNEWYLGDIDTILPALEGVVTSCKKDKYIIKVDGRVYPLSHVTDTKLIELGRRFGILNPWDRNHPSWRDTQVALLFHRHDIIHTYDDDILDRDLMARMSTLTGDANDKYLLSKLYLYVGNTKDVKGLSKKLDVPYIEGMSNLDLYNIIVGNTIVQDKMYESMNMRDLRELAKKRGFSGFSKLRKGELIAFLRSND